MAKIVVVEDDCYLRSDILTCLSKAGYRAHGIAAFAAPETEILTEQPDLVILDLNLPGRSGFQICQYLKLHTACPVLILTGRDQLQDELHALALGADDYLEKPCHPDRLLARAKRLLEQFAPLKNTIRTDRLALDLDTYKLSWPERHLVLPPTEGQIIAALIRAFPNAVHRDTLTHAIWGDDLYIDENILQVNVNRLRKRLAAGGCPDRIATVRGYGYQLNGD